MTKAGNATLALSNAANTFGGGANVVAGTLQIRSSTALPSASSVTVGGGSVDLYGTSPTLATISGAGTATNNNPSTTSTLTAAYIGGTASYSAAIQDGTGKIVLYVPSGGMLTLSNTANTFSGGSSVGGGTLGISADGNLGGPASGVAFNNGTLQLQGNTNFTLGSSRAISLAGSSTINIVAGQSVAIAGAVSGNTLTKTDGGMLSLTGANNYSGGTVINGGTLAAANDSLGAAGGGVTINNATLQIGGGNRTAPLIVPFGKGAGGDCQRRVAAADDKGAVRCAAADLQGGVVDGDAAARRAEAAIVCRRQGPAVDDRPAAIVVGPVSDNMPPSVLVSVLPLTAPAIATDWPATTSIAELPAKEIARLLPKVKFVFPCNCNVPLLSATPLAGLPRLPSAEMPSVPPPTDDPPEKVLAVLLRVSMPPLGT